MIHITLKALSIPPYLSTSWDNILTLNLAQKNILNVQLKDGARVEIPNLNDIEIRQIFEAHARHLESTDPFPFMKGPIPAMGVPMEHNPELANSPLLPPPMLEKIASIAKTLNLDTLSLSAEPHCNCTHCQVVRFLQKETPAEIEEVVTDEDLKFRNWDIEQKTKELYVVTNPLDANEYYNVFLGTPVGCTCGSKNCEHIRAVLDS